MSIVDFVVWMWSEWVGLVTSMASTFEKLIDKFIN